MRKEKKVLFGLLILTLLCPIWVYASDGDSSIPFFIAYIIEAFCTIHSSIFFFFSLSNILAKPEDNVKKVFWKIFFIRIILLLIITPIFPYVFIIDFLSIFVGPFLMTLATTKRSSTLNQSTNISKQSINLPLGNIPLNKLDAIKKCPYCQAEARITEKYCMNCGKELPISPGTTTITQVTPPNTAPALPEASNGTPLNRKIFNPLITSGSAEYALQSMILNEMSHSPSGIHATIPSIENRKTIMTIILSIIYVILMTIYVSYHMSIIWIVGIMAVVTIIYYNIVKKYNIEKYLIKEVMMRPDEKINYIVSSVLSSATDQKRLYQIIRFLILFIFIVLPISIFQKPLIVYEKQGNDYVVRYYTIGLLKQDTELDIPKTYKGGNVVGIRGDVFKNIKTLESIKLPETVHEIRGGAFQNCTKLKRINIPVGVTEIHGSTFENCISLESITIPEGVTRIGGSAFRNCTSLGEATIPKSVTEIGSSAFRNTNLKSVCISENASVNSRAFKETYPTIGYYENDCQPKTRNYYDDNGYYNNGGSYYGYGY